MTTYTEDEIALARRGAKWCGQDVAWSDDEYICECVNDGGLFVALLDKCDAEVIYVTLISKESAWSVCVSRVGFSSAVFSKTHKNRTLALLLALDAAGLLPKEDA